MSEMLMELTVLNIANPVVHPFGCVAVVLLKLPLLNEQPFVVLQ